MSIFATHTLTITRTTGHVFVSEVKAYIETSIGIDNNLLFTSKKTGISGNGDSVEYLDPEAIDQVLSISVTGGKITVNLATDGTGSITSTATLIKNAIYASTAANALVTVTYPGIETGAGIVTAMAEITLSGGIDATPKGYYNSGTDTSFTAVGNLQPAGKDDLLKLPEGLRDRDTRLFMTKTEIMLNDMAVINSLNYTAMVIEDFSTQTSIGMYEVIFMKDRGQ